MGFSSVFYVDIVCDGCINDDLIPPFAKSFRKGDLVVYEMGHRDFYLENWKIPGKWDYTEEHLNSSFEREGYETLKFQ